jgi:magnesium chelatase subunit D
LLLDAYRKRDRVGLVAFREQSAELLLPPTNSVELAERCLRLLPTGGRTPLAAGLTLATACIARARLAAQPPIPLLVIVTDGRANAAPPGEQPWPAALQEAERIRARGWRALVLDGERGLAGTGLARALSQALGAAYLPLDALREFHDRKNARTQEKSP